MSAPIDEIRAIIPVSLSAKPLTRSAPFTRELGKAVHVTINWYYEQLGGERVFLAGANCLNTSRKPLYVEYFVSFFDTDRKLIACAGQGSDGPLGPGATIFLGSCIVRIPPRPAARITSCEIVVYESESQITAATGEP